MGKRHLVYTPRAQRELLGLARADALRVLADLELLESPPWPAAKVKRLRGMGFWELKCGDYRAVFLSEGQEIVVARVVNRRDLERELGRIDEERLHAWLRSRPARPGHRGR